MIDLLLPDRELDEAELRRLVRTLAGDPSAIEGLAPDPAERRSYRQLFRAEHVNAWLIEWGEEADTGFHDHDVSSGAVHVLRGTVREERLVVGGPPTRRDVQRGGSFSFDSSTIHRVAHTGSDRALTVHAYSPPLWRMGAYLVEPDGALRRRSISYAEELRPLEVAA